VGRVSLGKPNGLTFAGLRESDVDVVTFGQYMRPTKRHMKVDRYVLPEEFVKWKEVAEGMGFLYVASGPLVRSSYKVSVAASQRIDFDRPQAGEFFIENVLKRRRADSARNAAAELSASEVADVAAQV
jgi:lipoic acid synthetase